jgi:cellulose synthase/poly-beta-1,6-N-acetylglucosamine synthase-like glycosyltransferase
VSPPWLLSLLSAVNVVVFGYFLVLTATYLWTTVYGLTHMHGYAERTKAFDVWDLFTLGGAPPITILAPAYNEEATCVASVGSLLGLHYPEYDIVVINDGSRDATLQRLTEAYALAPADRAPNAVIATKPVRQVYRSGLHPNLWVIDKINGRKADALNVGLSYTRTPLFCVIDADGILEREALARIVRPFLEDVRTVAAGGIIRIANGCSVRSGLVTKVGMPRNLLARIQVLEYLRAFLGGRFAWGSTNATMIISGAFGLFHRATVVAAGGFDPTTVGEDMAMVVRLHRHCRDAGIPYRIAFVPDPVAWTECPESLRDLGGQRERWQRGLTEVLIRNRGMFLNPRYGSVGLLAIPYFVLVEMLGPIIELAAYLAFLVVAALQLGSITYVSTFFLLVFGLGIALSLSALGLEELSFHRYPRVRDLFSLLGVALLEGFGYRQLSTWWRVHGLIAAARGKRGWGEMTRKGFTTSEAR